MGQHRAALRAKARRRKAARMAAREALAARIAAALASGQFELTWDGAALIGTVRVPVKIRYVRATATI